MFHDKTDNTKCNFLEQTKAAREERALEKRKELAATVIQANVRGLLARIKFAQNILFVLFYIASFSNKITGYYFFSSRQEFNAAIPDIEDDSTTKPALRPALQIYHYACKLLLIWRKERDKEIFAKLCRYIVVTLESDSPKVSYVGLALNKEHVIRWISHINDLLWKCCEYLKDLRPEYVDDMKFIVLYLHVLVSFTSTNNWVVFKHKNMEVLKPGMNKLCANLMGHLFQNGFYLILKV